MKRSEAHGGMHCDQMPSLVAQYLAIYKNVN